MSLFGWGKIKERHLPPQLADDAKLTAQIELLPSTEVALPHINADLADVDISGATATVVRVPYIDFDVPLAQLPTIQPRDWRLEAAAAGRSENDQDMSYLQLAGIDIAKPLELMERLGHCFVNKE